MSRYGLEDSGLERPIKPASPEWALPAGSMERDAQEDEARARTETARSAVRSPPTARATGALIAGILGVSFLPVIGCLLALALGYGARREIIDSGGTVGGRAVATAAILLGWAGLAVWLVLSLILLGPAGSKLSLVLV